MHCMQSWSIATERWSDSSPAVDSGVLTRFNAFQAQILIDGSRINSLTARACNQRVTAHPRMGVLARFGWAVHLHCIALPGGGVLYIVGLHGVCSVGKYIGTIDGYDVRGRCSEARRGMRRPAASACPCGEVGGRVRGGMRGHVRWGDAFGGDGGESADRGWQGARQS